MKRLEQRLLQTTGIEESTKKRISLTLIEKMSSIAVEE